MYKDEKIVLFDGTDLSKWTNLKGEAAEWEIKDGIMTVVPKSGNIITKEEFGDAIYHIEFCVPEIPGAQGQDKGNSGVFIQGRYEIQILESYGMPAAEYECGGLYGMKDPRVNASLPAGEWQSFDIIFRAPVVDEKGDLETIGRMTVIHNGVVIHNNVPLASIGGGNPYNNQTRHANFGPLMLQDHHCPVSFRNIYVIKL